MLHTPLELPSAIWNWPPAQRAGRDQGKRQTPPDCRWRLPSAGDSPGLSWEEISEPPCQKLRCSHGGLNWAESGARSRQPHHRIFISRLWEWGRPAKHTFPGQESRGGVSGCQDPTHESMGSHIFLMTFPKIHSSPKCLENPDYVPDAVLGLRTCRD